MSESIQAVFENGLLRPLSPLALQENTVVEIELREIGASPKDQAHWLEEFRDWIDTLDPDVPVLSDEQISRESIYKEQLDRIR